MDWIIKYFNITSDTDLIWLVIKAISFCVLLMLIYAHLPTLKNILISFFYFSKPKINKWLVQVSDTPHGKKVDLVWNVSGAVQLSIEPILRKHRFKDTLKVFFSGIYAYILYPFSTHKNESNLAVKKKRLKNIFLFYRKLSIPDGAYSFYLSDSNLELTLIVRGIWGIEKSSTTISNATVHVEKNDKPVSEGSPVLSKEFNELIYHDLLRKYYLSQKRSNKDILTEIFSTHFKNKNIVTKGEKLQRIHKQYKSLTNASGTPFLKPKRIHFQSNFIFGDYRTEFLKYREHQLNNNQFE